MRRLVWPYTVRVGQCHCRRWPHVLRRIALALWHTRWHSFIHFHLFADFLVARNPVYAFSWNYVLFLGSLWQNDTSLWKWCRVRETIKTNETKHMATTHFSGKIFRNGHQLSIGNKIRQISIYLFSLSLAFRRSHLQVKKVFYNVSFCSEIVLLLVYDSKHIRHLWLEHGLISFRNLQVHGRGRRCRH